jgi:hypothetical protein
MRNVPLGWSAASSEGVPSLSRSSDEEAAERVVSVEQWATLRREHFVGGKSIKELARTTGCRENTIRIAPQ